MPLVAEAPGWDRERLVELVRSQLEGVAETLERVRSEDVRWLEPTSRRTAEDLLEDVRRLGEAALAEPGADEAFLLNVANVQYDAIVAGIDLLKSHSSLPKVPRPAP